MRRITLEELSLMRGKILRDTRKKVLREVRKAIRGGHLKASKNSESSEYVFKGRGIIVEVENCWKTGYSLSLYLKTGIFSYTHIPLDWDEKKDLLWYTRKLMDEESLRRFEKERVRSTRTLLKWLNKYKER